MCFFSFITILLDNLFEKFIVFLVLQGRTGNLTDEKYIEF